MSHNIVPNSCRICLKEEKELLCIYKPLENSDKTPSAMLQEIAGIILEEVYEKPALPKSICKSCIRSLNQAFQFRIKALESQRIISNHLLKENENTLLLQVKRELEHEEIVTDDEFQYFTEPQQVELEMAFCGNDVMESEEQVGNMILDFKADVEKICDAVKVSSEHLVNKIDYDDNNVPDSNITNSSNIIENLNEKDSEVKVQKNYAPEKTASNPNGRSEDSENNMEQHRHQPDKELRYACDICDKRFKVLESLNTHKAVHSNHRSYVCNVCNSAFKFIENLRQHKFLHVDGIRLHHCELCNLDFRHHYELIRHERSIGHKKTKDNMNKHKVVHSDHRPHVCDVCNKTLKTLDTLRSHKSIHTGVRLYHCNYCNIDFPRRSTLKRHERSKNHRKSAGYLNEHSAEVQKNDASMIDDSEGDYNCDVCSKNFSTRSNMLRHRHHHDKEAYACNVCNKRFKTSKRLFKHKAVHSNHRPHVCDVCNKAFKFEPALRRHKSMHTG